MFISDLLKDKRIFITGGGSPNTLLPKNKPSLITPSIERM